MNEATLKAAFYWTPDKAAFVAHILRNLKGDGDGKVFFVPQDSALGRIVEHNRAALDFYEGNECWVVDAIILRDVLESLHDFLGVRQ